MGENCTKEMGGISAERSAGRAQEEGGKLRKERKEC